MALANSITGDGKLIDRQKLKRNLRDAGESAWNWNETTVTEVREWYAITESAALAWVNDNVQPNQTTYPTSTYTYSMSRDIRQIDGFTCRRTFEQKTLTPNF
jgi:hypothetical protein